LNLQRSFQENILRAIQVPNILILKKYFR